MYNYIAYILNLYDYTTYTIYTQHHTTWLNCGIPAVSERQVEVGKAERQEQIIVQEAAIEVALQKAGMEHRWT